MPRQATGEVIERDRQAGRLFALRFAPTAGPRRRHGAQAAPHFTSILFPSAGTRPTSWASSGTPTPRSHWVSTPTPCRRDAGDLERLKALVNGADSAAMGRKRPLRTAVSTRRPGSENPADAGLSQDGRGAFRTCGLSRVKRDKGELDQPPEQRQIVLSSRALLVTIELCRWPGFPRIWNRLGTSAQSIVASLRNSAPVLTRRDALAPRVNAGANSAPTQTTACRPRRASAVGGEAARIHAEAEATAVAWPVAGGSAGDSTRRRARTPSTRWSRSSLSAHRSPRTGSRVSNRQRFGRRADGDSAAP